jgi:hypothetical protein
LPWTKCTIKLERLGQELERTKCQQEPGSLPESLREAGDGMQLGDAKEGKDKASSLAKRVSERRAILVGELQNEGGQGESEGSEEAGRAMREGVGNRGRAAVQGARRLHVCIRCVSHWPMGAKPGTRDAGGK